MKVKYLGPRDFISVAPYGEHRKGEIKDYPDQFAKELLASSIKQQFSTSLEEPIPEVVDVSPVKDESVLAGEDSPPPKLKGKKGK